MQREQRTVVRIGKDRSRCTEMQREVRQCCVLSTDLFSLYSQAVIIELENMEGVRFLGVNVNNIGYVDDTVLVADTEEKLEWLVDGLN